MILRSVFFNMPKRPAKGRNTNSKPRRFKKSDGTIKKWNTIDDIPMDEEDQCKSTTVKPNAECEYA